MATRKGSAAIWKLLFHVIVHPVAECSKSNVADFSEVTSWLQNAVTVSRGLLRPTFMKERI